MHSKTLGAKGGAVGSEYQAEGLSRSTRSVEQKGHQRRGRGGWEEEDAPWRTARRRSESLERKRVSAAARAARCAGK
jgi:hypothetical protein